MSVYLLSRPTFTNEQRHCGQSGEQGRAMPACRSLPSWLDTNSPIVRLRRYAPGDVPVDD
jgi:hypothetical protein